MFLLRRFFCLMLSLLDMLVIYCGGDGNFMKNADVSITINPYATYQTIDGFGASACWWAQNAGDSAYAQDIAKALYSKEGLGLTIYRYNVGGGSKDNPNSRISGSRATESFYYYNEETGEYEYDFTRDAAAQKMLDMCLSYGCIDTVVLFANSPHYSMTRTGQATGGQVEYYSNLPEENYEAYADYFLTITEYFINKGVPVKYISPVNEPQWSWGGEWVGQEGCHYEKEEVVALFKVFAEKIKESGLDVKLMGPESGEVGETTEWYFENLYGDSEIAEVMGSLAYHSYWSDVNTLGKKNFGKTVDELYGGKISIDMTEWCELPCTHSINDFDSALLMARVISQDLTLSNANTWSAWVGVNNYSIGDDGEKYSDGLLVSNEEVTELYTASRYYAMVHFTKFIPEGSVRIAAVSDILDLSVTKNGDIKDSTKSLNISAFKTPEGKTVCVLVNEGSERNAVMSIGCGHQEIWTSTADAQMVQTHSGNAKSIIKLPEKSITTIVYG